MKPYSQTTKTLRRSSSVLVNVSVMLGTLAVLLLGMEMCLYAHRVYLDFKYPEIKKGSHLWQYDPYLGWEHQPGKVSFYSSKKDRFRNEIKINEHGLRDDFYPYEKSPGVPRVLLIGDSVTAGFEVRKTDLIDTQMEKISERDGKIEVINAGVQAYGTDQSYLYLLREGYKYSPDIIVHITVNNDPMENTTIHQRGRPFGKSYFILGENGELILQGAPVPEFESKDSWVMSHAAATEYYDQQWGKDGLEDGEKKDAAKWKQMISKSMTVQWLKERLKQTRHSVHSTDPSKPAVILEQEHRITERLFQEMRDFAHSIGAQFLIYEFTNGVGARPERPTEAEKMTRAGGIDYLQSFDAFFDRSQGGKFFCFFYDGHWNAKGHRLAAESIYAELKEKGWIQRP